MSRRFAAGILAVFAAACGTPTGPHPPPPPPDPGLQTPPIIRAITVPTSRVEAGVDIALTATVEDAETPLTQLTYQWAASAGTITGSGTTATWTMPRGITQGVDVVVTLTVIDTYDALENNRIVKRQFTVPGTSSPFRVHDSEAETKELARKFLIDLFGNSAVPPDGCLVDFSDVGHCARGKAEERDQIRQNREWLVIVSAQMFGQTMSFQGQDAATVVTEARFDDHWFDPPPGQNKIDYTHADFITTAIYDQGRWWLCESNFCCERAHSQYLAMLRAKRGPVKK